MDYIQFYEVLRTMGYVMIGLSIVSAIWYMWDINKNEAN